MWRTVRLGDVCTIVNGGTPKSTVKNYWDGDIKWLTPKDMGKLQDKYVRNTERRITADGLTNSSAKLVQHNSIILSCRAPIGHVFINECAMSFNQGCKGLIPSRDLLVEYLYYFLFASKKFLNELGTGTTFKEISGKTLSNVTIPLPPLAEQQRIVAKLDAAFAEIGKFQTVIDEKLLSIEAMRLKTYQAIINKNCSEQRKFSLSELVCDTCSLSYGIVQPGDEVTNGLPVVRPVDLKNKWICGEELKRIAHERATSYQRTKLIGDEVLLCVRGSTGIVSIASEELVGANVTRGIIPIRFADTVNSEYGYYAIQSEDVQKQIAEKTYGATLQQINVKDVKKLVMNVPKIDEQNNAIPELIEADEYLKDLKSNLQKQLNLVKQLKSAILAQELQPPRSEAA